MSFTKLDPGITESSIWFAPPATRCVWFAFLAKSDMNGFVNVSRPGMEHLCNVTKEEFDTAIKYLEGPDPESKSKRYEGRRIEKVDGGWMVINHDKYHDHENKKREQTKERVKRWRSKKEGLPSHTLSSKKEEDADRDSNADVTLCNALHTANQPQIKPEEKAEERPSVEPNRRTAYDLMRGSPTPQSDQQDLSRPADLTLLIRELPKTDKPIIRKMCDEALPEAIRISGSIDNLILAAKRYKQAVWNKGVSPKPCQWWLKDEDYYEYLKEPEPQIPVKKLESLGTFVTTKRRIV